MRLTLVLSHGKKYFWSTRGEWGHRPRKDISVRVYKRLWKANANRPVHQCPNTLPEGVVVDDPNHYVRDCFQKELDANADRLLDGKEFPWPYSQRPIKGLSEDPNYHSKSALIYVRNRLLLDPINQSLVFTNTNCESDERLPENVSQLSAEVKVDEEFLDLVDRRIDWCKNSDGILRKLPLNRVFPYLDQKPPRVYGIPEMRKEDNILRTLYDLSHILIAKNYGYFHSSKISHPYCVIPFERNDKLVILDLETDFITTAKTSNSLPLFSTTPLVTIDKPLASIAPLSWTTVFAERNIYETDYSFKVPPNNDIHTIYLNHKSLIQRETDAFIGRAILYCYGYSVSMARLQYGDDINGKELPDPIPIQCVFINPKDFSLGFMCFQLNTTSFDSSLKNQVWFKAQVLDAEEMVKNFVNLEINGFLDSTTKQLKSQLKQ